MRVVEAKLFIENGERVQVDCKLSIFSSTIEFSVININDINKICSSTKKDLSSDKLDCEIQFNALLKNDYIVKLATEYLERALC